MKVISILSVLLVTVAVTQAAPAPAAIEKTIRYTAENPGDLNNKISGDGELDSNMKASELLGINCRKFVVSGRSYTISCSGTEWYVWTDCSNGGHYIAGTFSETQRVEMVCPIGTTALKGGAFGH
ncbi:hypothetical protein BGZ65_010844 [Modicella reniformis]|uniref:Uncharacterized protein n=1 Tax=Modicella reniformis TaxID=1440133 RepID=A0A9P6LVL3_9FUNG|nr:hypothetical protein BGZ65_010844 [Modicella reniformis]